MNICSFGAHFNGVTKLDFNSPRTILDFDAVFVDCSGLVSGNINALRIASRREEFSEFLTLGRSIVVFTAPIQLEAFFPIPLVRVKPISGNGIDSRGSDYLKAFWLRVKKDMSFASHFDSELGQPFLFVHATKKPVGTLFRHESGNILFLPSLNDNPSPTAYQETCRNFVMAFEALNEHLMPKKPILELPSWATNYGWEREHKLKTNLYTLQVKSEEILGQIATTTFELGTENKLKALFTGKGDILVETVMSVLHELGVAAQPGEPGRDDAIVEFEGQFAVIEVKGKKTSAAEADAAQLEKWVAGFKEEKGKDPKGILLVNAFCETLLAERTEPAFPNQMLKYSNQREHCLITTVQFLGLLLHARAHPEKKIELVSSLFSTIGVYEQFMDWRQFLNISET